MKDETYIQHIPPVSPPHGNRPLVNPIYQSVKFDLEPEIIKKPAPEGGYYFYSRESNPTIRQLELTLAHLQGQEDALALSTGVSAIALPLFSLLKSKDHVIVFLESYKPTRFLTGNLLVRYGVTHSFISVNEIDNLPNLINENTRLILLESPSNPICRVPDFNKIFAVTQSTKILTMLDNTFAGLHEHGQYPFDLFVHSLTKFVNGHGDVMGGAVIGKKDLIKKIKEVSINIGATLDPHAAYLILRGLKTYFVRYKTQSKNAFHIARWLQDRSGVKYVMYPGLESHPDHTAACRQLKDFGAIVPFELDLSPTQMDIFLKSLKIFRYTASVGSTESLITLGINYATDLSEADRIRAKVSPTSIRLSIGLEDPSDLVQDIDQALNNTSLIK